MEKIFVDKHGNALFRCPHCNFERHFDASSYKEKDSRVKIKCRCGESVPILIEFREFYRKAVTLDGHCMLQRTRETFNIKLHDISLNGMSFSVVPVPGMSNSPFLQGDVVAVVFRLDNRSADLIQKKGVVRNVSGLRAGIRFSHQEYDKELGYYLMR